LKDDPDIPSAMDAQLGAGHLRKILIEDSQRSFGRPIQPRDQIQER